MSLLYENISEKRSFSCAANHVHQYRLLFFLLLLLLYKLYLKFVRVNAKLYVRQCMRRNTTNSIIEIILSSSIECSVLKSVCATNSNEEAMRLVERSKNGTENDDYFIGWLAGWLLAYLVGWLYDCYIYWGVVKWICERKQVLPRRLFGYGDQTYQQHHGFCGTERIGTASHL